MLPDNASHSNDDEAFRRSLRDFKNTMGTGASFPAAKAGVVKPTIQPCCDLLCPEVSKAEFEVRILYGCMRILAF